MNTVSGLLPSVGPVPSRNPVFIFSKLCSIAVRGQRRAVVFASLPTLPHSWLSDLYIVTVTLKLHWCQLS